MKKKLLALLLGACVLSLAACSSEEEESHSNLDEEIDEEAENLEIETPAEEGITEQTLLDAREEHTVELGNGTFTFRLTNAYVGDDAKEQLSAMGEDPDSFLIFENDFRLVLLEYDVKADSGFEEAPFSGEELLGYSLWETDMKTPCEFYSVDLDVNADKNYSNITLQAGEEATAYALYEMPEDLDAFADCLTGKDKEYWFLYQL